MTTTQHSASFVIVKTLKIVVLGERSIVIDEPLICGRSYLVDVVHQTSAGATTADQRLVFLAAQQAILAGAQGIFEVWKQVKGELPKGYGYQSFCKNGAAMDVLPSIFCYTPRKHQSVTYGFGQSSPENDARYDDFETAHNRPYYCVDGFLCFRESPE